VSIAVHCRAVSVAAHRLAGALRTAGVTLDLELVRTAALLHDIARAEKDHAGAGSRLLVCHGFIRLAPIVAVHMDLAVRRDQPVDEAQVVYLADKMMDGDRCVDMEQRFRRKMAEFNGDHRAVEAIGRRWESARMVRDKVEKITGRSIKTIVEKPSGSFDGET